MNEDNPFKLKGFLVWGVCALFFLYEFFLRTVTGTYQAPLMQDLNLNLFQFSLLSTTLFLLLYGFMQIPVGIIVENIGLKKSLLLGNFLCASSSLAFAYADNYSFAVWARLFMGMGASFGFICLLMAVYEWMPRRYNGVFVGLSQFIGTMGPLLSAGPLAALSEAKGVSWRAVFVGLSGLGFVIFVLVAIFVEKNKSHLNQYTIIQKPENIRRSLRRIFSRMQPIYLALLSVGLYFSIEYLSENEGRTFLMLKGISSSFSAYMISISWFGYAIGCPLLGLISDLSQRRKPTVIFAAFCSFLAVLMIIYGFNSLLLSVGFFILGIGASGQSVIFAVVAEQFKKPFVSIGFGFNNAVITATGSVLAPTIGLWLESLSRKHGSLSVDIYFSVFNLLIFMSLLAIILSIFFLKETYCKSAVDFTYLTTKKS